MLSYQHAYHAGNHADILKHYVLYFVLNSLNKKDKPYTFIDTHAGSGLYDLYDNRSIKTKESQNGIQRLIKEESFPNELQNFISFIKQFTVKNIYPGSPLIESSLMRKDDYLFLSELHPQEFLNLKQNIHNDFSNYKIFNKNGFEILNANTPPKTKRGAVLIDPSYEELEDYINCQNYICNVFKKWTNGIYLLWYPLLAHRQNQIQNMLDTIQEKVHAINQNTEILNLTLCVNSKDSHTETSLEELQSNNPPRLYGSGILVINAPWKLKEESEIVLPFLEKILSQY